MTDTTDRPRGGQADKRRAILTGALTAFARDGYTRAGIDAIAATAGVSARTIYNHFADKADLFQAVIQESASRAADAEVAIVERHLRKVTDLEADLVAFGLEWTRAALARNAEHTSMVRQVNAEAAHIPPAALAAWQRAGPLRVRAELAARLAPLAELDIDDPDRAAIHLLVLVSTVDPSLPAKTPTEDELVAVVKAGVRTFLSGYRA